MVVAADSTLADDNAIAVEEDTFVTIHPDTKALIRVKENGTYRLMVSVRSFGSELAQTSCSLFLNGSQAATIQTGGTDGQWMKQRLVKAELSEGMYKLELQELKQGMDIEWVEFKKL